MTFNTYHGIATTRVRCTRAHMGIEVGDLGTIVRAEDYSPGLDAGCFEVAPDKFPAASPYGHKAAAYWTREEMYGCWEDA